MEAVAAIGLTGNILQFIQYAAQLISTGNEIFESATGSSQRNSELEKIYATLSTFASGLQKHGTSQSGNQSTTSSLPISHSSENLEHFTALNALASDCEEVCGQLLGKIRCLKIEGKKWRACKSFRAALEAAWDGKSISKLESRLDRFQKVILLHFFPIISNQQSSLLGMTIALRKESHDLNLDQSLKLDSISNTLSDLVASNNQLTEELSRNQALVPSIREMSAAENESRVQNNRSLSLKSRVDGLATDISKLALTEHELEDVAKEQAMLRSINFPSRPVRHDNIPLSHEKTFRWMLESGDTEEHSVGERFRDWLSNEDGIFWVSGKPGSGKSTLMKFLADHSTTRVLLEDWSKDLRMVLASHYFWSAGTMMQKSHEGLLRTLLYEIFRLSPVLIRRVCPTRWEQTRTPKTEQLADWTVFELQQTLEAVSQCGDLSSKYCFFIDGIDEFDGDHFQLCETLIKLAKSPNFKMCLASRPWNVFVDALGKDSARRVCIEDLTRRDIQHYTTSRLSEHHRWTKSHFRQEEKQCIIDEITDKAQGVFLWVFLVTKSLRDGLTNGDTMPDLHNRLQNLPTDLEQFFKHMLDTVDAVYHAKTANTLSIAVNARQPLQFLIYSMHEHEYEDENYANLLPVSPLSQAEWIELEDECRRRINARCGGLLEVKHGLVEFLHRTVRDFLFTGYMSEYLGKRTSANFSADLSTFRAYVAVFKVHSNLSETVDSKDSRGECLLQEVLYFAVNALDSSEDPIMELLDVLEDLYLAPVDQNGGIFDCEFNTNAHHEELRSGHDNSLHIYFREAILRGGVDKYASKKLHQSPYYFDNLDEPPLKTVINHPKWTVRHMRIIDLLLSVGHCPNEAPSLLSMWSPWACFIQRTCLPVCKDDFVLALEADIFSRFIHSGAEKDARVGHTIEGQASKGVVLNIRACGSFVRALFSHPSNLQHQHLLLSVLDRFFNQEDTTIGSSTANMQVHAELLSVLQKELDQIEPRTIKPERLAFLAKATKKIVLFGSSLGWQLSPVISEIKRVFTGPLEASMVEALNTPAGSSLNGPPRTEKRKLDDEFVDRMIKRIKNTASDLESTFIEELKGFL